jgi:hypothetical protein
MSTPTTTLTGQPLPSLIRELDSRTSDGIEVKLLWNQRTNQVHVSVADCRRAEGFQFEVAPANALKAFHHPYVYAPHDHMDAALAA